MSSSNPPKTAVQHFNQTAAAYEASTGGCTRELARHVVGLLPNLDDNSVVLDNACGTGIAAEELLHHMATRNVKPAALHLVDAAPGMVAIARDKFEGQQPNLNIHCATMPAERLDFPDKTFTHSITNLGILFFTDADQGAKEIFRTLKPGGTAVVTSWQDLGYLPLLHQAQQTVRPDAPLINLPIIDVWFRPEHVREVLERAGFGEVEVSAARVHYAGERARDVSSLLNTQTKSSLQDWSEDELERFEDALDELIEAAAEKFEKPDGSAAMGIPMVAIVAVCRK